MRPRLALAILLAVLVPSGVAHASAKDVIRDCTDDEIMSRTYTQKEYRAALRELAADADQYGNCRDVILRAQQAALAAGRKKKGGGGGAPAGGFPGPGDAGGAGAIGSAPADEQLSSATETERQAVAEARATPSSPVLLDTATVDPAKAGSVPGLSQVSQLPAPLAVLLALMLAAALALSALRIRRLVHTRRA